MENKTLQDFKREVAIDHNLMSWGDVLFAVMNGIIDARTFDTLSEEAAERYANYKADKAWGEASEAQKKIHAQALSYNLGREIDSNIIGYHSSLIPNAPYPYKQ